MERTTVPDADWERRLRVKVVGNPVNADQIPLVVTEMARLDLHAATDQRPLIIMAPIAPRLLCTAHEKNDRTRPSREEQLLLEIEKEETHGQRRSKTWEWPAEMDPP